MKKLKIYVTMLTAFVLLALLSQTATAQDAAQKLQNSTPQQRAQLQTAMMKNKLQLDSGQVAKVAAINLKYAQEMDPLLKGSEGKFKRMREMKSIQSNKSSDLKKVFTADQYKAYQQMEEEMKEKLKQSRSAVN